MEEILRPKVGIIGCGRFGALWAKILSSNHSVRVFDVDPRKSQALISNAIVPATLAEVLSADVIFYAVPISAFEATFHEHVTQYPDRFHGKLIVDLLSIKVHPKNVFEKYLPQDAQAFLCHAMFGPHSVNAVGLPGLKIVIDPFRADSFQVGYWKQEFQDRGLQVFQMSAEQHDEYAAMSQGLTHFVGRILGEMKVQPSPIDTLGAQKLFELKEQVCNDSMELFRDLQTYNPSTLPMRILLGSAQAKIYNQLIPNRIHQDTLVIGIQGGKGSFNEEAVLYYLKRAGIENYEFRYLYTTEKVLKALHEGEVDRGQFAIHNSLGGIVTESIDAMSRYNFQIIEEYAIKISHTLMMRADATFDELTTIMTHPQVLRQCGKNLSKKYSKLFLTSGEGDLIGHSKIAELLGEKALSKNIATIGSRVLADLYGLKVIEENLQDLEENFTSFLFVERPA